MRWIHTPKMNPILVAALPFPGDFTRSSVDLYILNGAELSTYLSEIQLSLKVNIWLGIEYFDWSFSLIL